MFAAGDVAQQIPQEVIDYAAKLGINTTGLNADQIRAQLQRKASLDAPGSARWP